MTSGPSVLLIALLGLFSLSAGMEYCLTESFTAGCDTGHVVVVQRARFGRIALGRCATRNYGNVGCSKDVIGQLDAACSGRQRCELSVSDQVLVRTQPCPLDFSSYLDADYSCVKVLTSSCEESKTQVITTPTGYISSTNPSRDSHTCDYQLSFPVGQRVNLTLIDFTLRNESLYGDRHLKFCQQYAIIEEPRIGNSITVCGGDQREKAIYFSRTSQVNIKLKLVSTESARFLIKYQAVGCPNIALPDGTFSNQVDDALFITCNVSRESFLLRCQNHEWVGEVKNCSISTDSKLQKPQDSSNEETFGGLPPIGISLVIILGVALVIVVYIAIMIICVMFIRRRRKRRGQDSVSSPQTKLQVVEDPYGHTRTISSKMLHGHEERLPMLGKPQPLFRASGGDYTDICEMHEIGSCMGFHSNFIRGSSVAGPGQAVSPGSLAGALCNHSVATSQENLRGGRNIINTIPVNADHDCGELDGNRVYDSSRSLRSFRVDDPRPGVLRKPKVQSSCRQVDSSEDPYGKCSSPDLVPNDPGANIIPVTVTSPNPGRLTVTLPESAAAQR